MLALGVRMALNLEYLGLDAGGFHDGVEQVIIKIEVADADGADLTGVQSGLQGLPAAVVVAQRLMQVHEIEVFKTEPVEHFVKLLGSDLLSVFVGPELGGDPDAVARNAAVSDSLTYAALIAVGMGGIDMTVTGFECGENAVIGGFPSGDGVHAESELRDDDAVIEGKGGLVHG